MWAPPRVIPAAGHREMAPRSQNRVLSQRIYSQSKHGSYGQLCDEPLFWGALPGRLLRQSTGCLACEAAHVRKRPQYQMPVGLRTDRAEDSVGFDSHMTPGKTELVGAPSGAPCSVRNGARRGSTSSSQQLEFPQGSDGSCTEWDFCGLTKREFRTSSQQVDVTRRSQTNREPTNGKGNQGTTGNVEKEKTARGKRHREVCGCSEGEHSVGCNPKGASGTKQGREGSGWSVRCVTVRNPACRQPGGGNSGMTSYPVPQASKGKEPHGRRQKAAAI